MVNIEESDIGRCIHILSRQVKRKVDEALSEYNVTAVQCSLIGFIFESNKNGSVYAKDIESRFNMRRATVAEILSLMEKNGLIERKARSEDARLKEIRLTNKSLEIKNSIENIMKNESNDDLNKKGRGARKFICDNKNSEVQGKRIKKFIKSILKEEENYDCK